jgi:hypothetical protein
MNLQLYMRVLSRFKVIVLAGVVLGILLAFLSYATPSMKGGSLTLKHRTNELWEGDTTLLLTQTGFPWGRSTLPTQSQGQTTEFGDPGRLTSLAPLYAQLATSDQVRLKMLKDGPIKGKIVAAPVLASPDGSQGNLPMIMIAATATSKKGANALSWRAATAVRSFLEQQQNSAKVPASQRVVLQPVQEPLKAKLVRPRKKTLPIMIFMTMLLASCGLALVLENLRPRPRIAQLVGVESAAQDARRSA